MTYRTGNHQPQNLYRGDAYIGVMFDPADTALIVDALEGEQAPDLSDLALRLAATKVRAARPGVEPQTALAVVEVLVAMGWRPPSARAIQPESDQNASGVPASTPADPNAAETAYPNPAYRFARCGQRSAHGPHVVDHGPDQPRNCRGTGPGCICNDPPPTVDKPKNGTATRPDGWTCPRHGTVI